MARDTCKERGIFRRTNLQNSISQERYSCLHTAVVDKAGCEACRGEGEATCLVTGRKKRLAVFKTLANMVAVVKFQTDKNNLANVEAKAFVNLLANTLLEVKM